MKINRNQITYVGASDDGWWWRTFKNKTETISHSQLKFRFFQSQY